MKCETPEDFMSSLNLNEEELENGIKFLEEWDKRPDSFYSNELAKKVDKAEREHMRNCITFWCERLKNENRPT